MYITEMILEGFKSYPNRTVISAWDPEFNAITGLNGSGKSNILDAICFVLGISNLSQVRASNLQDLVYKRGQAGITKASVTIEFDNSDPNSCPVGYEQYPRITVTRQVRGQRRRAPHTRAHGPASLLIFSGRPTCRRCPPSPSRSCWAGTTSTSSMATTRSRAP